MTINNPYKKRLRFDDVVISPADDISMTKIHEKGKWKMVDDIILCLDACWDRLPPRSILTRLFNGSTKHDELVEYFKNASEAEEMVLARNEKRQPKNPFQFNDARQKFVKEINELKILGIVEQTGMDLTSENNVTFSLTEDGISFVKKKLADTIEKENLDVFMVLLGKENKKIFYSNLLMKIAEIRKTRFDQLLLLIDDMESKDKTRGATGQELLREYVRYLSEIEEEPVKPYDAPVIYSEIMNKISKMVASNLVEMREGMYFLTRQGNAESNNFTGTILSTVDFLSKAGLLVVEELEQGQNAGRYMITLKPEGLSLAKEIKEMYENDENRIIEQGSALDDFDLHETEAVIPIDVSMQKEKDKDREKRVSLYVLPKYKLTFNEKMHENMNAIVGSAAVFLVMFLVVGFIVVPISQPIGFGSIIVSVIGIMITGCMYPASIEWIKRARNQPEKNIIETQFEKRTHANENMLKKLKSKLKRKKKNA